MSLIARRFSLLLFAVCLLGSASVAQAAPNTYITMPDGVKLAAFVEVPGGDKSKQWPVVVEIDGYQGGDESATGGRANVPKSLRENYALVRVSIRGTGCSGGEFHLFDQQTAQDGYNVVEWAADQPWSNGRVGLWGHSYGGLTATFVAGTNPPSLTAVTVSGIFDDTYRSIALPGGIPNIGFAALWPTYYRWYQSDQRATQNGIKKEGLGGQCAENVAKREPSTTNALPHDPLSAEVYAQFLGVGRLDNAAHRERSPITYAQGIRAPIHITSADQDEQTGPTGPHVFEELRPEVPKRLLLMNGDHNAQGIGANAIADRIRWMDHWMRDVDNGIELEPPLRALFEQRWDYSLGGELTGTEYPLQETDWQRWYLRPERTLSRRAPSSASEEPDAYVSGTRRQSWDYSRWNYTGTKPPVEQNTDNVTQPEGPDELTYRTARFTEPKALLGPIAAKLYVSLTTPDTDFFVQVSDVFPDGSRALLQRGLLRASHRKLDLERSDKTASGEIFRPHHTFTDPEPVVPGQVNEYLIRIFEVGHVFRPGHRLEIKIYTPPAREQLWSYEPSNFAGLNKIHHDVDAPSSILLPFVPVPASLRADAPNCGSLINVRCMDGNSSLGGGPGGGGGDFQDPNQDPAASFDYSPAQPHSGEEVTFTSTSSDPDGEVVSQAWDLDNDGDFDDGEGASAKRSFSRPGTYTVQLRVWDDAGATDTAAKTVTVANRPPRASFDHSPQEPRPNQEVTFTSTSMDPDGEIVSQAWDLDNDGEFDDGEGTSAQRRFRRPTTYTIRLRVTDDHGATDVAVQELDVVAGSRTQ